jgi:hypothetical protein
MDLRLVDYDESMDAELLELFYQSIFYKKKEFEYVRVPNRWIYRYGLSKDHVTKILVHDNEIVASLGVIIQEGRIGSKRTKVGCFVDNCILPRYLDKYTDIFQILFKETEEEIKERGVGLLCGWEFLKNVNEHHELYESIGFQWVEGINWFSNGIALAGDYPFIWKSKINLFWRAVFKMFSYYNKMKSLSVMPLPGGINLREMRGSDLEKVCALLKGADYGLSISYDPAEFENNIQGVIAEKGSAIVGILTYITSAWSGWMFGKPFYKEPWQTFFGFTPDEFWVLPEYQDSSLPEHMLIYLVNLHRPKGNNFVAGIFDRRMKWRRDALLKLGFTEPRFDNGAILAKSLDEQIKLDPAKVWHLPARYILAPVPSPEELGEHIGHDK